MRRWLKPWIWILAGALVLVGVLGAVCWRLMNITNIWQASCVGDIPTPRGFVRDTVQPQSYQAYLRALPLIAALFFMLYVAGTMALKHLMVV